ncbi:MAG TPA: RsmE family RNA methyltransferase [Gemmatales bacterium]|nr:RsmE family RNA methyltransferase [Gemmatales bacterium]
MSDRFYVAEPLQRGPMSIIGPEAHHIAQVLRLQSGDEIVLFNGDGREYPARLELVKKSHLEVEVLDELTISKEAVREITVACPLPKGDRATFLIEKLTELGVAHYVPLRTARSVVHPGGGKLEKLQRQVIEASKQCGRNVLMTIEPMMEWDNLVQQSFAGVRWIADASGTPSSALANQPIFIALGPEGGWIPEELSQARQHQWQVVSLGKSILRIETATIAAAAVAGM